MRLTPSRRSFCILVTRRSIVMRDNPCDAGLLNVILPQRGEMINPRPQNAGAHGTARRKRTCTPQSLSGLMGWAIIRSERHPLKDALRAAYRGSIFRHAQALRWIPDNRKAISGMTAKAKSRTNEPDSAWTHRSRDGAIVKSRVLTIQFWGISFAGLLILGTIGPSMREPMTSEKSSWDAYAEASAKVLGFSIDADWKPGVSANLETIFKIAGLVEEFELPEDIEPAPSSSLSHAVFCPRRPIAADIFRRRKRQQPRVE